MNTLNLSDGLQIIKKAAFKGCHRLKSFIIPATVEFIYQESFANCNALENIIALPEVPPFLFDNSFSDFSVPLKVPKGYKEAYQSAQGWKNFVNISDAEKYKLTYVINGDEYKTYEIEEGSSIFIEPTPIKEGYTFSGWSEIPEIMPAQDVIITGSFSVNSYTLTYKVDGEVYKTSSVAYGTALTPENAPTKEGYTFSGWSEVPATMPANDVVITGTFSANNYTLTYKVDGEVYKTSSVAYGTALTPENAPTKEGYTFSGWSEIPETMPAQDVVVTGTFTVNTYAITFMYNDKVLKVDSVEYGATIPLPTSLNSERYTLIEWLDVPETMPAHDITIYASVVDGIFTLTDETDCKIYNERGLRISRLQRGLNIIKYSNGRIRKVIVK